MDYWELREAVKRIIPRRSALASLKKATSLVNEKGRKKNYQQFSIVTSDMEQKLRLLKKDQINSFLEISLRAAHCPMPFNMDVWDRYAPGAPGGIIGCPLGCIYCFSDLAKASLYSSFFDVNSIGYRHCNPDYFKREMDKAMRFRNEPSKAKSDIQKAFAIGVPVRLGIRFEDFCAMEAKKGIALEMLRYLADAKYDVMINTKSDLLREDRYLKVLSSNRSAVHITMISNDETLLRKLEPGAPSFKDRLESAKALVKAGVRVVARIEPFMVFINDERDKVDEYIGQIKEAGIEHLTLDTYSYSAGAVGLRRNFSAIGIDFERMYTLMSDCQWLGSLLLGKFMQYLRSYDLKCSTFDFGQVPENDDFNCCQVGDWFKGLSFGNTTMAIRFIASKSGSPVTWEMYEQHVLANGGWLSERLRLEVMEAWCGVGNQAYMPWWGQGITPIGISPGGRPIFVYNKKVDHREELFKEMIG